jgi:hypothetical protein
MMRELRGVLSGAFCPVRVNWYIFVWNEKKTNYVENTWRDRTELRRPVFVHPCQWLQFPSSNANGVTERALFIS